jgi:hypothetical protein
VNLDFQDVNTTLRKEREEAKKKRRNKWKNSWKRMSNFFGNLVKEDSDA